jgi:hypothetical protein
MKFANLLLIAALSGGLIAQETEAPGKMAKDKMAKETTMTGCLNKAADGYVLTNEKTGKATPVTGPAELEKHAANHKVKVTGAPSTEGGKRVFTVAKIEHVADKCELPTK